MLKQGQFKLVLTDCDVISKLAHWRLLHRLPEVFACEVHEISTLPSVTIRAMKAQSKPDKLFRDSDTAKYAYDFLIKLPPPQSPDGALVSDLQRNPNIDSGEALLIAIALTHLESLIVSGDKRALKSIAALQMKGELLPLQGRVLCLEQVLDCMIKIVGFSEVQACIRLSPEIDTAARIVWGSRIDASQESVNDGLRSYIDSIRCECQALLLHC